MSAFEKLLGELDAAAADTDTIVKSLSADGGEAGGGEGGAGGGGSGGEGGAGAGTGATGADTTGGGAAADTLAKSFKVKLANGEEVDAFDGSELLKSLMARMDSNDGILEKAFGQTIGIIKQQGEMIKALSAKVTALGGEGRGRKAMLTMHERPNGGVNNDGSGGAGAGAGAGSGETLIKGFENITGETFMLKANAAYDAKKLSGVDLGTIDVCLRTGQELPKDLISKVVAASAAT